MIYDCHAHIASSMVLPSQWYEGWVDNMIRSLPHEASAVEKAAVRNIFGFLNHDENCDALVKQMNEAGIDKTVLLIVDWGLTYEGLEHSLEDIFLFHKNILDRHPERFWVFAGVDPRRGQEGLDLFEKSIKEFGFHGLKLYPPCGFSVDDQRLGPYYELCARYELPVLSHIGPSVPSLRAKFATPIEVDTAAWQFPKVNFIMGHGAVTYPYECGLLAAHRPNIYLDISGFQAIEEERLAAIFENHLKRSLHKKLLFATDWPIHFFSGSQKNAVGKIKALKEKGILNEATYDLIMYQNFERLIKR